MLAGKFADAGSMLPFGFKTSTKKKFNTPAAMKLNIIVVITMWLPLFAWR